MAITAKLELRQTHSLVMTPQLQQAIKLLQLSHIELAAFVETELERNPLLERADSDEVGPAVAEPAIDPAPPVKEETETQGAAGEGEAEAGDGDDGEWVDRETGASGSEDLDVEPHDVFPDADDPSPGVFKDSGWSTLGAGRAAARIRTSKPMWPRRGRSGITSPNSSFSPSPIPRAA